MKCSTDQCGKKINFFPYTVSNVSMFFPYSIGALLLFIPNILFDFIVEDLCLFLVMPGYVCYPAITYSAVKLAQPCMLCVLVKAYTVALKMMEGPKQKYVTHSFSSQLPRQC